MCEAFARFFSLRAEKNQRDVRGRRAFACGRKAFAHDR